MKVFSCVLEVARKILLRNPRRALRGKYEVQPIGPLSIFFYNFCASLFLYHHLN
jgi:hypothetical protein